MALIGIITNQKYFRVYSLFRDCEFILDDLKTEEFQV